MRRYANSTIEGNNMKNKKMLIAAGLTLVIAVAAYFGINIPVALVEPVAVAICALAGC